MRCEEIMSHPVTTILSGSSIAETARRMRDANVGLLPVCNGRGQVLGVVTDRDIAIRGCGAERPPASTPVNDIMNELVISCLATDTLSVARDLMERHKKARILIMDGDDQLVGILSLADIAARLVDKASQHTIQSVASREVLRKLH